MVTAKNNLDRPMATAYGLAHYGGLELTVQRVFPFPAAIDRPVGCGTQELRVMQQVRAGEMS